jgi:hypothetical protein
MLFSSLDLPADSFFSGYLLAKATLTAKIWNFSAKRVGYFQPRRRDLAVFILRISRRRGASPGEISGF